MATNADQLAPGAEPNELADDLNAPAPEGQEREAEETPEAVAEIARKAGWVPREEFRGDPSMWKPAEQYILDGREIQREQNNKLRKLESTLENIAKTNAGVMEAEIARRVEELSGKYTKAVEDGDPQAAYRFANEIGALTSPKPQAPSGPGPEAQEFAQRNSGWFQKDPLGTALAIDICNRLAAQGYDHPTQLAAAEKEVRRVYPHLFGGQMNGQKPQPGVNRPGARGPIGNATKEKGFAEMPLEAQKAYNDMIERGVIKAAPDEAKKLVAKYYWQNAERKA